MIKRFFLLLTAVCTFGFLQAQDQQAALTVTADEILENYFENVGGKEQLQNMKTRKLSATMAMQGMEFPGIIYEMSPNKQRVEVDVQGQQIVMAYNGEDAWWIMPFQTGPDPQDMPADQAEGFTKQTFESPFINYSDKGHTVELIGKEEVDGAETYALKLTKENGDVETHYFDTEYFVPIMMKTQIDSGPAKGQFVEQYFSDYQEVDGFMIPFYMETKVGDMTGQKITVKEVMINPELDEAIFSRPE